MAFGTRKRRNLQPITFLPCESYFAPQVEITMRKDVSGWADRKRKQKWSLSAGKTYMVDESRAVEFIVKGYAQGDLPREVSDDERAELLAQVTTIGVGSG